MAHDIDIAHVAAQIGHPIRAAMLDLLLSTPAATAGQLAATTHVSRSAASQHLRVLEQGALVTANAVGRHRWYRLAGTDVAEALEALARIAPTQRSTSLNQVTKIHALRAARTCYDHLAGRLGVALADTLLRHAVIVAQPQDGTWTLSDSGVTWFDAVGLQVATLQRGHRPLIRQCLDWSERRPHLAGTLGSELLDQLLTYQWIERIPGQRALRVNPQRLVHPLWDPLLAEISSKYSTQC